MVSNSKLDLLHYPSFQCTLIKILFRMCSRCIILPPLIAGDMRGAHPPGGVDRLRDEDDQLLQFAIQQSLVEAGTENDQVGLCSTIPGHFMSLMHVCSSNLYLCCVFFNVCLDYR